MTDDTDMPSVDEILDATLHQLNVTRNKLLKAASWLRLDPRPIGSPLTPTQSQARTVTLDAIDDAKAAIDRATRALHEALRTDEPPRP